MTDELPAVGTVITDDTLRRAVEGDERAFAALYLDVQPRLRRYASVLVGADADDVTGEAWVQIIRDLSRFRGDLDGFRGWSARIVRNRAIDLARTRARRPADAISETFLAGYEAPDDTEFAALDRISTEGAVRLIAGLPREQAEAVLLRAVVGLDAAAAGAILGKSPAAVRVAAHRGLKTLRRRIAGRRTGRPT